MGKIFEALERAENEHQKSWDDAAVKQDEDYLPAPKKLPVDDS